MYMGVLVQILVRFHMDRAEMDATHWCGLSEKADRDEVKFLSGRLVLFLIFFIPVFI
jgi:hypothetical protein